MKAVSVSRARPLPIGARITVTDNSGGRILRIIGVKNYKGVSRRLSAAGIADIVIGVVEVGKPELRKTVVPAVIVRTAKEFRRADGTRIKFQDNACVILKELDEFTTKGTMVKGPIAKEAVKRFASIGKIASVVV
ncbi:MAG: uL14 family ribosomal protein [Candidatus Nanoarchaeia archaeon]|nr:uL14 family ribosomal protein [Candidatus Nanoarchaeia archaeon]